MGARNCGAEDGGARQCAGSEADKPTETVTPLRRVVLLIVKSPGSGAVTARVLF